MVKKSGGYYLVHHANIPFLCLLVGICLFVYAPAHAQNIFKGVLLNKIDSSIISYAAINVKETGQGVSTGADGVFQLTVPKGSKQITLTISAIGCKTTVTYKAPFSATQKIYLDVTANTLQEFAVKGLSAREVVEKAVASIPFNDADTSYFDYSFYRRYQKLNGRFVNLFEACPAVMFRLSNDQHKIIAKEAYAVNELRRSNYHPDIMNEREDNPADLLILNPVYHLEESSLNPEKFPNYQFSFDTTVKSHDYVIKYVCNSFSTDIHGIGDYAERDLKGEEWEAGELVIDRATFAIKQFHRKSIRHQDYGYKRYPLPNNLTIYDHHKYFFEFVGGDMQVEYAQRNGKWYLKKMCRQYTNEYYLPVFDTKEYTITDNFEWYSDSISRYTTKDYIDKFYPKLATAIHSYDTIFWTGNKAPFYYFNKEIIYNDLVREGPLDEQFTNETKIDEYVKKPAKIALYGKK